MPIRLNQSTMNSILAQPKDQLQTICINQLQPMLELRDPVSINDSMELTVTGSQTFEAIDL